VGETFNQRFYDKLSDEEKTHFKEDYSDESIADQIERNQKKDDKLSN